MKALLTALFVLGPASPTGSQGDPEPKTEPAAAPTVSTSQAPLPPAPPDLPRESMATRPWRGQGWFALRAAMSGPLDDGATPPASSRVTGLGWGFEFGYRARPVLGVGVGYLRTPHDVVQTTLVSGGQTIVVEDQGRLTAYDFLILRFFVPTRGRFEPFFDVAGGLSVVSPALSSGAGGFGGQLRVGAGLDIWLAPRLALDMGLNYRMNALGPGIGHLLHGTIGLKFHW